jgi:hypothetical protein
MSDTYLHLIPINSQYVPSQLQIDKAVSFLLSIWPLTKPTIETSDEVMFIDQGGNFVFVQCPQCGLKIDQGWWSNAMSQAFANHYCDLSIQTPCGHQTTLNDLNYYWPAGFARFRISFLNPSQDFDHEQLQILSHILGCELRKIRAHY